MTGGGGGYRPHYPMQAKLQEITSADAWDRKLPPTLLFPLFAEILLLLLLFLRIHLRQALTMAFKTRSKLHFIVLSYAVNIRCLRRYRRLSNKTDRLCTVFVRFIFLRLESDCLSIRRESRMQNGRMCHSGDRMPPPRRQPTAYSERLRGPKEAKHGAR